MKKYIKIILLIAVLIVVFIIGFKIYGYSSKRFEINRLPLYYRDLAEKCLQKDSYGCCMASIRTMKNGNYKLSENNACEDGFTSNTMLCIDSFKWCEPIKP